MELLNSIKKQRELFSQTLSTVQMPKDLDSETSEETCSIPSELNLELDRLTEVPRRPLSPRNKKSGLSDARQLVSSLRNKREDLIKRFERAQLTTHKSLGGEYGENEARSKQNEVVDLSLLECDESPLERPDSGYETPDFATRAKPSQEKIEHNTVAEFRNTSVSESLAKFEKRCPNDEESSERRSILYERKRRVTELWREVPDERDSTFRCVANGAQNDEPSSTTEYPSRTAHNESDSGLMLMPTVSIQSCDSGPWKQRKGLNKGSVNTRNRKPSECASSDEAERKHKPLDASWIKTAADPSDREEPNKLANFKKYGTIDSSWIKKAREELENENTGISAPWIKHDAKAGDLDIGNPARRTTADMALAEEASEVSNETEVYPTSQIGLTNILRDNDDYGCQPDFRRPSDMGTSASIRLEEKRRSFGEPSWVKNQEARAAITTASAKRKLGVPAWDIRSEHTVRRKLAIPAASWIKQNSKSYIVYPKTAKESENDTQTLDDCLERTSTATAKATTPSWGKQPLSSSDDGDMGNAHTRRNSVSKVFCVGKAGPPKRATHEGVARRKSIGDVSWIKKNGATHVIPEPQDAVRRALWFKPDEQEDQTARLDSGMSMDQRTKPEPADGGRHFGLRPPSLVSSIRNASIGCEEELSPDHSGNDTDCEGEPHNMALSDKVSMFESPTKAKAVPPTTGVKAVRQNWAALPPAISRVVERSTSTPQTPIVSSAKADAPKRPTFPKVSFTVKTCPPKNTKISSLINKMEKFSLGGEFDPCGDSVRFEEASVSSKEDESDNDSGVLGPSSQALTPASSVDQSIILEYGDAGFSFTEEDQDQEDEAADQKDYLFEESDEASEGSTYKIDNYQKDFNEAIPIESPWVHPQPGVNSFEAFPDFTSSERNRMTIVSIAPSTTVLAPSCDELDLARSSCQEYTTIREQRSPSDKSLATRRTHHHVARSSLLSAARVPRRRSMSVDCISGAKVDPIFQVFDDLEHKSSKRSLKKLLSKPKDDEACSSQEENKPTTSSSKKMLKMLKKGLGTSSSSKKEEPEEIGDGVPDQTTVDDYYRADSRTTISSITRSVTSNPGSQRSSDSKPTMPLGVLNGFFKAARKLQKKSKRKSRRGRSMSNKPPLERRAIHHDSKPDTASTPPAEVQLWPNYQGPEPTAAATSIGERRFGTYGGLLYASRRSRALNEPTPSIQSMASW